MNRYAADYDRAFEEWAETGPAEEQYASDVEDGIVPVEGYDINGNGIRPQSFEEWINSNRADEMFEAWFEEEVHG